MTTPFANLLAMAAGAINGAFGEEAELLPRRGGQYAAPSADPERDALTVVGVYTAGSGAQDIRGQRLSGELRGATQMMMAEDQFWISAEAVAVMPWAPKKGDRLTLTARTPAMTFTVVAAALTSMGDMLITLAREAT